MRRALDLGRVVVFLRCLVERGQLTQLRHHVNDLVRNVFHLGSGVEATQAEADRAVSHIVVQSQRLQDVAWLQLGRGAGLTGRDGNIVDAHQQALTLDVDKAHIEIAG